MALGALALAGAMLLGGCQAPPAKVAGEGDGSGTLQISLVDAHPTGVQALHLTFSRVEVHRSDPGEWLVVNDVAQSHDVLALVNGAEALLGEASLPAGHYTQIRAIVADASIQIEGMPGPVPMDVPSGSQTGLKLVREFTIVPDAVTSLVLDFDAARSVVLTGDGRYKLRPTARIVPRIVSGSISGTVTPLGLPDAVVTAYAAGTTEVVTTTPVEPDTGGYRLVALIAGSYDIEASAPGYETAREEGVTVVAGEDSGGHDFALAPVAPPPFPSLRLVPPDQNVGDGLGWSAAISGDYAIAGVPRDDERGTDAGAAYVFHHLGAGAWDGGVKLLAPAEYGYLDNLGTSVALAGDFAIAGAPQGSGAADYSGVAHIFQRTGANAWSHVAALAPSDGAMFDDFGASVAIHGDMAAVGAPLRDAGSELQNRGAVYLYRRNAGSGAWELLARLDAPDTGLDRLFGFSVALDGDYLAVGVRWGSTAEVNASGAVYVYRRTGPGSWSGPVRLTAAPPVANAWFGSAVSLSGDYLIVGAEQDGEAGASAGAAYIFRRTGTNAWDDQVKILAPDAVTAGDFGFAVSISGDVAVATAVYADAGTVPDGGAAYLLRRTGLNAWGDVSKFHAPDPETIGWFGHGAGISGTFVIIGASQEGPANEGAAYLFDVTP